MNNPENSWWSRNQQVIFFSTATFFFWMALYVYSPILSVYSKSSGATLFMVGLIVASYSIPQLLLRVPIGILSNNRSRRKPILITGILLTSIGALGLGLVAHPWSIFFSRTVTGIGAATWVTFTIYFTSFYRKEESTKAIGVINTVQGVALVTASYAGGLIAQAQGYANTFFVAASLGIVAVAALVVSKTPIDIDVETSTPKHLSLSNAWLPLAIVCFMGILSQFAQWAGLFGFMPIYAAQIGATSADLGVITTLCLAATALASFFAVRLVKNRGNSFTILLGALLLGGTLAIIPLIHSVTHLKLTMLVNGVGRGILSTILMALSIQTVAPQQRAMAMGIYQAAYAVGMILGPLTSGYLAQSQGLSAVFYLSAGMCMIVAAIAYLSPVRRRLGK